MRPKASLPQRRTIVKIAIFGPYKSGTTALFYRVRNSWNRPARLLFEPYDYVAEPDDDKRGVLAKVILGKPGSDPLVHYDGFREFDRRLLLVRDPRDLVVSGTLFFVQQERRIYENDAALASVLDLLRFKEAQPAELPLKELLAKLLEASPERSIDQFLDWLAAQYEWLIEFEESLDGCCRVNYESLVEGELGHAGRYLGFPLRGSPDPDHVHGHVPRTRSHGDWRHWFTPDDVATFRPLFHRYMARYGYADDWTLAVPQVIDSEFSSRYVERVCSRRRDELGLMGRGPHPLP